ncbi:MAG: ATP-binding protein [Thermomicrobiales bacterium]
MLPLVMVATALLAVYLLQITRGLYLHGIEDQLVGQARLVSTEAAIDWQQPATLDTLAKHLGGDAGNRVTIIAADGVVLGDSEADPRQMENHAGRPEVRAALAGGEGRSLRISRTIHIQFLYAAVPIAVDGRIVGVARVARPLDQINAQLAQLRNIAIAAVAASGLAAAILALILSRYIIQPIDALRRLADNLAAGQLDQRSAPRADDELGRLGRAFNRMAGELSETIGIISDERAKLAAVLETMGDGLLMIEGDGTSALANRAAETLLTGRDVLGHPLHEVTPDPELTGLVREATQTGRTRTALLETGRARRAVRAVAAPVRGVAGTPVLLVLHDQTELRRLETARRDFVANISHELRTPLASIKALVETLEDGAIEDESVARTFLHQVDEEVDHLTELVRELLELSRIESGEVALEREPIPVTDLIDPVVRRLSAQAERAGVALTVAPLDGLPPVLADPGRTGHVLLNLLHNAIKFTPPGGAIAVTATRQGGYLAITVRDSGSGIEPAHLPRIFERFYKADKARSSGGAGLGLAIAKHLVNAHGGALTARNNDDGPGASFTFTLPLASEAAALHTPA